MLKYYELKCGRGSTAIAQGKAHATKVVNAGGSLADARVIMLKNAERKGVPLTGKDGRKAMESAFETQVLIGKTKLQRDRTKAEIDKLEANLKKTTRLVSKGDIISDKEINDKLVSARAGLARSDLTLARLKGEQDVQTVSSGALGRGFSTKEANRPLSKGEEMKMRSYIGNYSNLNQKKEAEALASRINQATGSNITPLDAAVIKKYTNSNFYVASNETLRGQLSSKGLAVQQAQSAYARQINQSLQKLPKYRGEVTRVAPLSEKDLGNYQVGKSFTWNGMTSTSKDNVSAYGDTSGKQKLQTFTNKSGDTYKGISYSGNHAVANYRADAFREHGFNIPSSANTSSVTFKINSKSGRDISSIGRDGDNEVLLPHGFKGKVTRREGNTIYIDEV
jgi:hypothetical protein